MGSLLFEGSSDRDFRVYQATLKQSSRAIHVLHPTVNLPPCARLRSYGHDDPLPHINLASP